MKTKFLALALLALMPAYAQVVQVQQGGSNQGVVPTGKYFVINCSSGLTCSPSGVTITMSASGSGTVTSVTFTGDGTVLSSTPSSAVTTSGTLTAALANAGAGTVLGNPTGSAAAPVYTAVPVLGAQNTTQGTLNLAGSAASPGQLILGIAGASANAATLQPGSNAGAITLTLPINTGTLLGTASANTAAAGMTLDLSGATGATAFKVPVQAGATSGADGVIVYDSTNKNTHIRSNGADALAVTEVSALSGSAIPKASGSNLSGLAASSITDNATVVASTEPWKFGTAGGNADIDLTMGSTTSAMTNQSSATCTNITGMTWTILANKSYRLLCYIPRTLAASATMQYCLGGPGTPTSYNITVWGLNGASSAFSQIESDGLTTYGTKTTASSANANTSTDIVFAFIQNGATASGTALTLQTAANGTNNITVNANASCDLKQVN